MSVNSLILRLRNGDRSALEDIYKKYRISFIKWITYTHKCNEDEAVDIEANYKTKDRQKMGRKP